MVRVPVDGQGRMRADALPAISGPTILCLQAGNVNSGAFDPAAEIIPRAKAGGAWVHVDGAFGLWAAASPALAHLTQGLEQRYAQGPLFDLLHEISEPLWLLSNHRTEWLMPRLERFGLADRFERIYVSDAIGFVKPDPGAFRMARAAAGNRVVTYVDDKPENVAAAAGVFERAMTVPEAIEQIRA